MLDNFQKSIRSVVLQPLDRCGGIKKGNTLLVEESNDFILFEAFMLCINEMVAVAKPNLAFDTPMVVDEIGVEKVHAPTLFWRRETAEEQHFGVGWQKRL